MKAEIKNFYSPDIDDLRNYHPDNLENFCFLLRILVGIKDSPGEESFDIQVCTPLWLLSRLQKDEIIPGRHFLFVQQYNFNRIYEKAKYLIESCSGKSWNEIAAKVGQFGYWEFDNYQE